MLSQFLQWFKPPVFEDPDKTRRAKHLHTLLIVLLVVIFCWVWYPVYIQGGAQITVGLGVLGLTLFLYILLKAGQISFVGNSLTLLLWMVVIGSMAAFGGIRNSGFSAISIVIVIASITLGARAGILYTVLTIIAATLLGVAEINGLLPAYKYEPTSTILISHALTILGVGFLLIITLADVKKALQLSRLSEEKAKEAFTTLEQNRMELEQSTVALDKRNIGFQTILEMSRFSTQAATETELLGRAVRLIAEKCNADHAGIFLADELEENLILSAVSSPEGEKYLDNRQALKITDNTLLYSSPQTETISYRKGNQILYISRPKSLSESGTNLSFPISFGVKLVGLLNIQSTSPGPWTTDAETIAVIADQIALSLENIRLLEQQKQILQEIGHLAGKTTQVAWKKLSKGEAVGYQFDQLRVLPSNELFPEEVYNDLIGQKSSYYLTPGNEPRARLVAPLILRENVIGVIGYEDANPHHDWLQGEINMLETIASRVSLALENSRLVAEAEQRAERERVIGQISSRMRETHDFETVLQTAIQELHRSFELQEAEIRLQSIEPESSTTKFEPDKFQLDAE